MGAGVQEGAATPDTPADPEPAPAEEAVSVRFPASFLYLCALSRDDVLERDCTDAVEVSDDLRAITVTARPCFTDDNDAAVDLYMIMVACGYLQLFDGQEDWGFRAAFVDADTGVEVPAADMPGEGLTISRDIWADALSAAGA